MPGSGSRICRATSANRVRPRHERGGREGTRLYWHGSSAVIAHSGLSGSCSGMFAASTKRRTSSTEARLAFAVLTRERNAA